MKLNEPASPEEMVQRRRVAVRLRAKMVKPATEYDRKLWQEFMDLGRERLTFRFREGAASARSSASPDRDAI